MEHLAKIEIRWLEATRTLQMDRVQKILDQNKEYIQIWELKKSINLVAFREDK